MANARDEEGTYTLMAMFTKVNGRMIWLTVLELMTIGMVRDIEVSGEKTSNTARV